MEPFDIINPVRQAVSKRIRVTPQKTNRASSCGHPCEKYLVFSRTRWNERLPHDVTTQMIFDCGNVVENYAIKTLQEAGIQIIEQQRSFEWPHFEVTGHLDAKILHDGKTIPIEIKSMSPYQWDKINSIEDMLHSNKHYVRGYPAQLSLYMLSPGSESELAVFYIVNKLTFEPKVIWMHQDYSGAEDILKKLERVNAHVKAGTEPEGICEPDICQYCGFLHICLPSMKGKEIEILELEEVETALQRCEELKPLVKEYEALDKQWKKALKEKEKVLIGDFLVTGKWIEKKEFTVPASKYWQSKIIMKPGSEVRGEE